MNRADFAATRVYRVFDVTSVLALRAHVSEETQRFTCGDWEDLPYLDAVARMVTHAASLNRYVVQATAGELSMYGMMVVEHDCRGILVAGFPKGVPVTKSIRRTMLRAWTTTRTKT